ncbi:MAG: Methylated-DNA/protein-cysteine methyltransferase [Parcubacteria group bacterium GW2011_GWC2_42_6]|nr:MAG: Methylated-DNA/protein-cysteine methyltransferase [Parcubacteria group bacterium GW2011_GWA2_42_11]KKS66474.1 MAG: Methylated-DNA/protein-cysteine methyltransferase [Parcubacteria group bacterium GW2011_GWC2_42_6]
MTEFEKRVYDIVRKIPRGRVLAYGEVARQLGDKNLARAVGNALNRNCDKNVPCHRVTRSNGRVGGFNRGTKRKIELLKSEGINIINGKVII